MITLPDSKGMRHADLCDMRMVCFKELSAGSHELNLFLFLRAVLRRACRCSVAMKTSHLRHFFFC